MTRQVRADVWVPGLPASGAIGFARDLLDQGLRDSALRFLLVRLVPQMLGHRMVEESVDGAPVLDTFHDVGAGMLQYPAYVGIGVGFPSKRRRERRPEVTVAGQTCALGIGQREKQAAGPSLLAAEAHKIVIECGSNRRR
jgi:hypothetical protein